MSPADDGQRARVMSFPETKRMKVKRDSPGCLGRRQPLLQNAGCLRQLVLVLLTATRVKQVQGFRLVDENGTILPFVPYEQGFVGR